MGHDRQADLTPNKPLTVSGAFSLQAPGTVARVSAFEVDLRSTVGFQVADAAGRLLGRVECPMYGTAPDVPDAVSVKGGFLSRRRRVVPADAIRHVDSHRGVIGLGVGADSLLRFL